MRNRSTVDEDERKSGGKNKEFDRGTQIECVQSRELNINVQQSDVED